MMDRRVQIDKDNIGVSLVLPASPTAEDIFRARMGPEPGGDRVHLRRRTRPGKRRCRRRS
jgi:hypothetical protein